MNVQFILQWLDNGFCIHNSQWSVCIFMLFVINWDYLIRYDILYMFELLPDFNRICCVPLCTVHCSHTYTHTHTPKMVVKRRQWTRKCRFPILNPDPKFRRLNNFSTRQMANHNLRTPTNRQKLLTIRIGNFLHEKEMHERITVNRKYNQTHSQRPQIRLPNTVKSWMNTKIVCGKNHQWLQVTGQFAASQSVWMVGYFR